MHRLPSLTTARGTVELPLAPRTAASIAAALAANQRDDAARLLTEPVDRDAPFAIWTVIRAAQRGQGALRTAAELAQWLASRLVQELDWPVNQAAGQEAASLARVQAASLKRAAELAGKSYGVARQAARVAENAALDPQRAHLLGLLHGVPQWLESPADRELLPEWIRDELARIHSGEGALADCVGRVLSQVKARRGARKRPAAAKISLRAYSADAAAVAAEWHADSPVAAALPALAAKLRRLHALEEEFQRRLEHEKLESLKELAYGAGHEINNPLANISARAQTLLQSERDPERRRLLAAINTQAFRAHEMIADMMLFARPPQPRLAPIDLVETLRALADELRPLAEAGSCKFTLQLPDTPLVAHADKTQVAVAIRALCTNAIEAQSGGGHVELRIDRVAANGDDAPSNPGETVQITVTDSGPGIPPEMRPHIFDPFFSGREAGRGLGFGLSKCWRIVSMHGGRIEVASRQGQGSVFTITLPRRPA